MEEVKTITIACRGAEEVNLDDLIDLQGNLKDLSTENYVKLRNSIVEYGFSFPILYWQAEDGRKYIIDAHQRKRTLQQMRTEGYTIPPLPAVPVIAKDKVEAKKKLLLLNSRYGQVTQEGFYEYINEEGLELAMEDMADLLEIPEIELEYKEEIKAEEDEAPEVDEANVVSELGKVYKLGNHRVMCGDATSIDDMNKLMVNEKADMIFTDPPYGYSYSSNHQDKHKVLLNDDKIIDFFPLALTYINENAPIYTFTSWQVVDKWIELLKQNQLELKNMIIWKKNNWSMGDLEGAYAGQYEIILYSPKGRVILNGERDRDIWEYDREAPESHPTIKPVGIAIKAISKHTIQSVLDLFGGSGTTLIAAEQTAKKCFMMELSPAYVDVIRKRYAKIVGQLDSWQEATPEII